MSIRTDKVASVVKKALAGPINDFARSNTKGSLVTITSVVLSKDLSIAKVYLSIFGGKDSPLGILALIEDNSREIRSNLASQVHLRSVPELKFFLDDTLDQMEHIQKLIDKSKSTDNSIE